jgi:hypothetical protein
MSDVLCPAYAGPGVRQALDRFAVRWRFEQQEIR